MKTQMIRQSILILLASFLSLSTPVQAGHFTGNGGDYIRGTFMKMGSAVLDYLRQTPQGQALVQSQHLDLDQLAATLTIEEITVIETGLKDNRGSVVDATGTPGLITLNKDAWLAHYEKERDVYYLVFHEMLRSAAVQDDNYVISASINPFPIDRKIATRLFTVVPLVDDQNLSGTIDPAQITIGGSGCTRDALGYSSDFDVERNMLELDFTDYTVAAGTPANSHLDRKSCSIAIPVKGIAGRRLMITQADLSAKLNLSENSQASVASESFLAGTTGVAYTKPTTTTADQALQGRTLIRAADGVKTPCGADTILRLNTSALVTHDGAANSVVDVDRISIFLRSEACQ